MSWRLFFSFSRSSRSTTIWVAMPAWSVPGSHIALYAAIRRQRVKMSSMVSPSACPMCSEPVTFGGGMTMANGALGAAASAWK